MKPLMVRRLIVLRPPRTSAGKEQQPPLESITSVAADAPLLTRIQNITAAADKLITAYHKHYGRNAATDGVKWAGKQKGRVTTLIPAVTGGSKNGTEKVEFLNLLTYMCGLAGFANFAANDDN